MKSTSLSLLIITTLFCSTCNNKPDHAQSKPNEVPAPLTDESSDLSVISKGYRGNSLTDLIYNDMLENNIQLKKLEEELNGFNEAKSDSLKTFYNYNNKSDSYYSSANAELSNIKDTVLQARLRLLLANSKHKYEHHVSKFSMLIRNIDSSAVIMNDYRQTLKIVATLPVIEKYQNKNMPNIKSAADMATAAEKLKNKTVKLAQQYQSALEK